MSGSKCPQGMQWRIQDCAKGGVRFRQKHRNAEGVEGQDTFAKEKNEFFAEILHFAALLQALNKFLIINSKISETHMHSLESNASPATSQRSVVDVADCRISVASQDTAVGRMSPNINIATPNLVSLRRPPGELYSSRRPILAPSALDLCPHSKILDPPLIYISCKSEQKQKTLMANTTLNAYFFRCLQFH